jgi:hypothetical protein
VKLSDLNPSTAIAAAALLVAGLSALYARRSWQSAEKASRLDEARRSDELQPRLHTEVITDGDAEKLHVVSRGPQNHQVRVRLVEPQGQAQPPIEGLWVTGMPLTTGAIGLLKLGDEFSIELMRARGKPALRHEAWGGVLLTAL